MYVLRLSPVRRVMLVNRLCRLTTVTSGLFGIVTNLLLFMVRVSEVQRVYRIGSGDTVTVRREVLVVSLRSLVLVGY